jgi:hypothetical protein
MRGKTSILLLEKLEGLVVLVFLRRRRDSPKGQLKGTVIAAGHVTRVRVHLDPLRAFDGFCRHQPR